MALKLTNTASEILNDIILHQLQESSLEKAEALEDIFFSNFNQLESTSTPDNTATLKWRTTDINGSYKAIYQHINDDIFILAIVHPTRHMNSYNP